MTDALLDAVSAGVRIFDLGRPFFAGMPQSPNHPKYTHTLPRRHGDMVRPDGGSAANDLLVMGTHVGTHIDALAHVSQDGLLHGGANAGDACIGGGYPTHGVHTISPIVRRGVVLDIPRAIDIEVCEPAYQVTTADLDAAVARQGARIDAGDVVLIRTGWGRRFADGAEAYLGTSTGVPGISEAGANWLADREVIAAGADTIAFEWLPAGSGHSVLPAHRVLLVEHGIYIIEALDLEELADAGVHEFTFILVPLNLQGATGSPVRPLAVVPDA
ncbi:cyclase family protein [Leifsonia bigeumensis]|uniref:Cyclase family protein n=1 Tax=Leifsonella bigeumensis TaxID=433643 RepID=A0ABP7FFZ0_9MICO